MNLFFLRRNVLILSILLSGALVTVHATDRNVGGGTLPYPTIQDAIDASATGDVVKVYPGNYSESATNRTVVSTQGSSGPYQFGLFFDAAKPGISVVGVDASGNPVTDYNNVAANVQLNATNGFGPSGVFVNADNITVTGLNLFLDPAGSQNKTVEVIGDNFTIRYCRLTDGNSLYLNDWSYDKSTSTSHVTKYTISGNSFEKGTSIDIADGAGYSGPASGRIIQNNAFDAAGGYWAMVSFNGAGTGVPWFIHAVGGAVISGNSFINGEVYIRQRGTTVNDAQFNWSQYFNNNTFDKSVITLADESTFTPRDYSYPNDYGTYQDVKQIGTIIQFDVSTIADPGDVVRVGKGTYNEGISVDKTLTFKGAKANVDARTRSTTNESIISNATGAFGIAASNVVINGFTIQDQTDENAAPGFGYAIYMGTGNTGTQVLYNIIKNNIVGSSLANTGASQVAIKYNLFDSNNQPGSAGGQGIYTDEFVAGGIISNVLIDSNKFTGNNVTAIDFSVGDATKAATGITISNNNFDGNYRALFLYNVVSSSFTLNEVYNSTGTGSGDVRVYGGVNNFTVTYNNFYSNEPRAVRITDEGGINSSNITVNYNNLLGYSLAKPAVEIVSGYTGTLDANCNWWGTVDGSLIQAQTVGAVDYEPWLTNGTDNDPARSGFQTTSSCNGTTTDYDGDGVPNATDCNPLDPAVGTGYTYYPDNDHDGFGNPASPKTFCSATPPSNYVSNKSDCNDAKVTYADLDGDGYGAGPKTPCGVGNNTDCNDHDAAVHLSQTYYKDYDKDGYGDPNTTTTACSFKPPTGYVKDHTDCNDHDAGVHSAITYYRDYDKDGYGDANTTVCVCASKPPTGYVKDHSDCNDHDAAVHSSQTYYKDYDKDGYGDAGSKTSVCSSKPPAGYVKDNTDCNDRDKAVHSPQTYYKDYDKDGYGDPKTSVCVCSAAPPAGFVKDHTDCNDKNKDIHPGAKEIAGNKIDDNCNGKIDEKTTTLAAANDNNSLFDQAGGLLKVTVLPNPSSDFFTLRLQGGNDSPAGLRIIDVSGRLLESREKISSGSTITLGHNFRPGTYFVEVRQGSESVVVKCIKQ